MENTLRDSFIPIFRIRGKSSDRIFFYDSVDGLDKGIEYCSTNGLGYKKIRTHKENDITTKRLYDHLRKMDDRVRENRTRIHKGMITGLISDLDNVIIESKYISKAVSKLRQYVDQKIPKWREAYWDEVTKNMEKTAEIERLKKELNKKSLIRRIFG
jgi:hypothetical protein